MRPVTCFKNKKIFKISIFGLTYLALIFNNLSIALNCICSFILHLKAYFLLFVRADIHILNSVACIFKSQPVNYKFTGRLSNIYSYLLYFITGSLKVSSQYLIAFPVLLPLYPRKPVLGFIPLCPSPHNMDRGGHWSGPRGHPPPSI
jgi:hypothetical protein